MIERPGTWGEVTNGTTLLSPTQAPLVISNTAVSPKTGRLWYQATNANGRTFTIQPKDPATPVVLLEMTPEEGVLIAKGGLNAHHLIDMEREARMAERAKRWKVPAVPTKGKGALNRIKDHLSWYHGTYTTDIRTLRQALDAHTEMHDEGAIGGVFMDKPHTHKEA